MMRCSINNNHTFIYGIFLDSASQRLTFAMALTKEELAALACPKCHAMLYQEPDRLVCTRCGGHFNVSASLIDLCRCAQDAVPLFVEDEKRAQILRSRSNNLSIPELTRLCYELPKSRTSSMLDVSVAYMLRGEERMKDALSLFGALAKQRGWCLPTHGVVLDLGCGVATATGYLTKVFDKVFAVNPASDEMVIAERINRERFDGQITLIRAFGEHLPFQDDTFDLICGLDIIEHIAKPAKVLKEVERVLKPGGLFFLDSPNRYNIVSADPHVQIKFIGFIPENMRESYVRWRTGGMSWVMRNVHPLSWRRLDNYLRQLRDCDFYFRKVIPTAKAYGWKGKLVQALPGAPFLAEWFILIFGSTHHVVVKKKNPRPEDTYGQ